MVKTAGAEKGQESKDDNLNQHHNGQVCSMKYEVHRIEDYMKCFDSRIVFMKNISTKV